MARITTQVALIAYIKSQLGAPTINIEVTDTQMEEIITDTVQKFTEYAHGTLEETVIIQFNGAGDYDLPNSITNIIKLSQGATSNISNFSTNFGSGYVPNIWSDQFFSSSSLTGDIVPGVIAISTTKAMLDKYFGDDLYFNFNPYRKILTMFEPYIGAAVLHYQYEYLPEAEDFIYDHEWIKQYSKAKVKELWGGVTGKYAQTLVGGAVINYDRILQEAREDILMLDEQLLSRWSDPAPISIG